MKNRPLRITQAALLWACAMLWSFSAPHVSAQHIIDSSLAPSQVSAPASKSWQQLTPQQKQALAPLGAQWGALTGPQQNKWLVISKNFQQMSVAEQITMHNRMADWVGLSPQQRNVARLNFQAVQKNLPKEDKRAKWEAYQALSTEEKRQLSAGALSLNKSAAPTAKPVEAHRLVQTPLRATDTAPDSTRPATAVIDRKTLLPKAPAIAAPAPLPVPDVNSNDVPRSAPETSPS